MDRKLWESLQRFESRDYLTRYYEKLHGRMLNAQRSHEIATCFTQGREYFISASMASETVKPLLIYYGISSIGRGVILLKDITKREESLTPAHGLITVDWTKTLHSGISEVLNLKVQCAKGTFSEFVHAVGNSQPYAWLNSNLQSEHFWNKFEMVNFVKCGNLISLGELLSREVDLFFEYRIAHDGGNNVDLGYIVAHDSSVKIYLTPEPGVDAHAMIQGYHFPHVAKISAQPNPRYPALRSLCIEIPAVGEDRKKVVPMAFDQGSNVGWVVRPFQSGDNVIDIHRMYIESFILGMLSRYFSSKWTSILRGEKGDIARSVILAAVARFESKFPRLLQEHLAS